MIEGVKAKGEGKGNTTRYLDMRERDVRTPPLMQVELTDGQQLLVLQCLPKGTSDEGQVFPIAYELMSVRHGEDPKTLS